MFRPASPRPTYGTRWGPSPEFDAAERRLKARPGHMSTMTHLSPKSPTAHVAHPRSVTEPRLVTEPLTVADELPSVGVDRVLVGLSRRIQRRPRLVLACWVALVIAGAAWASGVHEQLSATAGFTDPGSESVLAESIAADRAGVRPPSLILTVTAPPGSTVDGDAARRAAEGLADVLAAEQGVGDVTSAWSPDGQALRSEDGRTGAILVTLLGDDDAIDDTVARLGPQVRSVSDDVTIGIGGAAQISHETVLTARADLARAELIVVPLLLVLLLLIFRSVVAAALPLLTGLASITLTLAVLRTIGEITTVSAFALNLTTALGLGLSVDYALLIVSRYRAERRVTSDATALDATMLTTGRTVLFSALTTSLALSTLVVFPLAFLRSFAFAGVGVVLLALASSLVALPALLFLLGDRLERGRLPSRGRFDAEQAFRRLGRVMQRRPLAVVGSVVAVLLILGVPFLDLRFGPADHRALPIGAEARSTHELLQRALPHLDGPGAIAVTATAVEPGRFEAVARAASTLSEVASTSGPFGTFADGTRVAPATSETASWMNVRGSGGDGEELVRALRSLETDLDLLVGGRLARSLDAESAVMQRLPLALGAIGLSTFALLALAFRSVVAPLKAVVVNLLSLTAAFGAVVWVFQQGHLAGPLDFTATGRTDLTTPILLFCVAFGLSIDYEVILLSAIRERWLCHGDDRRAVVEGLGSSARIISASALLLIVVFGTFATSGITMVKLFGVGLAIAIFVDATLVRFALVPALMSLAGAANWWPTRPRLAGAEHPIVAPTAPDSPSPRARPPRPTVPVDVAPFSRFPPAPEHKEVTT